MKNMETTTEFEHGISLLASRNTLPEAEDLFRRIADQTDSGEARIQLGIALRGQGKWKEASATLKRVVNKDPNSVEALAHLARTFHLQQKHTLAQQHYELALKLQPDHNFAKTYLAQLYFELGDYNIAHDLYKEAILNAKGHEYGLCQHYLSEISKIFTFLEAQDLDTALDRASMGKQLYNRAVSLTLENDIDTAIECYELAAKCRTDYSDPDLNIGATIDSHQSRMPKGAYQSCSWLEEGLHFHENRLTFCCTAHSDNKGWTEIAQFNGGKLPIDYILAKRAQVTNQLICGTQNNCTGCPKLEKKEWEEKDFLFNDLIINSFSVCNFRCTYCSLTHLNFEMPAYYYPLESAIDDLLENKWLSKTGTVTWGGGDPSVSKEFRPVMSKMLEHGSYTHINTNASIHIPEVDEGLVQNKCDLMVSVDAGTRSTFYAIKFGKKKGANEPILVKGKEVFSAVWETIGKYAQLNADKVTIKYIVDDINASEAEIDAFVKSCVENNVKKISYTPEAAFIRKIPVTKDVLPKHIYDTMRYAAQQTLDAGLQCMFDPFVFRKEIFHPAEEEVCG